MGRVLVCEKTGLRKGTWSPDEDKRLVTCISKHGAWNWRELPKYAGLERCGKSCRLRWLNYLRPFIKRGKFTSEEDQVILDLHAKLGNKWSKIAEKLPGRTDNEIKNHWHTHLSQHIARSNNIKYKNIKREKLRNSNDFLHSYRPNDKMVSSILDSSTISPTSPHSSTGYSSCTVDDKVGIPKTQLIHETSLSSEPNLELEKNFNTGTSVLPSLPLAYPISPLGEVIQSFFSSIGQDNDMFSSSATVRNQVTGTTPWEENMMDDGVTSSFIGNSFLPPLTPFTETFYSHALYDSNDTVIVASEVLSKESSEQTEHIFGESFNMEYNGGELELPLEEAVFSYRLWE